MLNKIVPVFRVIQYINGRYRESGFYLKNSDAILCQKRLKDQNSIKYQDYQIYIEETLETEETAHYLINH